VSKLNFYYKNLTVLVKITLVHAKTVLIGVSITLYCNEITLYLSKSIAAYPNSTAASLNHTLSVKITLWEANPHSACQKSLRHTFTCQNHTEYFNRSVLVDVTLVRVNTVLFIIEISLYCNDIRIYKSKLLDAC
jgi:hypothetical protein